MQGPRHIADFKVTAAHKAPEGASSLSCKVSFELDLHGLVRCTNAVHCHKIDVEEAAPAPAAAPKEGDAAAASDGPKGEAENGDVSNMETDTAAAGDDKPGTVKKQKKVCEH
jgi:hypothetical protein